MNTWKSFAANEVTHSMAHYLTTLLKLHEERGYARVSDVAKELDVTKGSVSVQKKHLKELGYVIEDENKFLRLTGEGMAKAKEVLHNRRILIQFIENVLGVDPLQAEMDACKIEHLISWETCHQLLALVHLLQSREPAAVTFRETFKCYKMHCSSPETCNICGEVCLVELENQNFLGGERAPGGLHVSESSRPPPPSAGSKPSASK
jgi:Mn-dependent DtxR family transcriptional regulator